jgi:hypothetical protein
VFCCILFSLFLFFLLFFLFFTHCFPFICISFPLLRLILLWLSFLRLHMHFTSLDIGECSKMLDDNLECYRSFNLHHTMPFSL